MQNEEKQPTARSEDDVKMIHNLEETVSRLHEEIKVLNVKVSFITVTVINYCEFTYF